MHILFIHKNYPAQFGHIAQYLFEKKGFKCTFISETEAGVKGGIQKIKYVTRGGATRKNHYCSRSFESGIWHSAGIYEALKNTDPLNPDLIVGHSGFGTTLFLHDLFPGVPVINYFEFFYYTSNNEMDFRPEWPVSESVIARSRARNAMILLDMQYCSSGYVPTQFQVNLMPEPYKEKISVIHDGIDMDFWRHTSSTDDIMQEYSLPTDVRIVTYVSRGFESVRGFDIFMKAAKKIYQAYPKVVFLVIGSDRVCYGGDLRHIKEKSFKEHVLKQDDYDLDRIRFLGKVEPTVLVKMFSISHLHIYLTAPFVPSWSLLNAMACGCTVLASDTTPVHEFIQHNRNGLLCDFFDVNKLASMAVDVIRDPQAYSTLGKSAEQTIRENYSMDVIMPKMVSFYEKVLSSSC